LFPPTPDPPIEEPTWPPAEDVDTYIQKVPQEESLEDDDPEDQLPDRG
jgi:hypothetical protein